MSTPRVVLADDHALILGAFEKLLTPEFEVVGTATDGRALLAAVEKLQPDVVVADIAMPLLNGLDAAGEIKRRWPFVRVVLLTMNDDPELVAAAFRMGVSGYVLKRSAASELLTAIREAMKGRSYVTPIVTEGVVALLQRGPEQPGGAELTPRQREVLQLLAEGHSMKQVADVLNVTARTVAFHKYRMMAQLRVRSSAELIQHAIRLHLV